MTSDPRKEFRQKMWGVLRRPGQQSAQKERREYLRQYLWALIEHGQGRIGRLINTSIFFFIILSIIILPIELFANQESLSFKIAEGIEISVTALFTVEYVTRIFAAPRRWRYIFSWWGIVDLFSILPYYITLATVHPQAFRFLRLIRVIRILKIAHMKSSKEFEKSLQGKVRGRVNLAEGETIERVVLRHPIFLMINLILPLIFGMAGLLIIVLGNMHQIALTIGAVFGIFMLVFLYKAWLDYHYDVMYITNYRIIFQNEHLFGRSHSNVEYRDIVNIHPCQEGILPYLFGYGSVTLETSSDQSIVAHKNIRKYSQVAQHIHEKCREHKTRSRYDAPPAKITEG